MATKHPPQFLAVLFERMQLVDPAVAELELYEFRYSLDNLVPLGGWGTVQLLKPEEIEALVNSPAFYEGIQTRNKAAGKVVVDERILNLTRTLLVGLADGSYPLDWIQAHFFFDVRAFLFFHRTHYYSEEVLAHFGGTPYRRFAQLQQRFARFQGVGYQDFREANCEVDQAFIKAILALIAARGTPILMTLAGPTAAGKTEITERLLEVFAGIGKRITTIEMDNFLLDREIRGEQPMGKNTHHFEAFRRCLEEILQGKKACIPRYDFVEATSSHNPDGSLKSGRQGLEVQPADIIFIEGNFPFQIPEIADLIAIKVVYLTDDAVRLKRKWKRDIDYRKKYDPNFFINRYFKTQFLRAEETYLPQMKACDLVVDTTQAALWVTPQCAALLKAHNG